jgi:hypothetical protein
VALKNIIGIDRAVVVVKDLGAFSRSARLTEPALVSHRHGGEISTMNDLLVSFLVFALIFGGALLGAVVRPLLSEQHLHPDSRDVVKMKTGLIGTLAALVLGLLIASANSTFDLKTNRVRH